MTRPDDDPEGFMKLREALDAAKQEIMWREQYGANEEINETTELATDEPPTTANEDASHADSVTVNISPETIANLLENDGQATPQEPTGTADPVITNVEQTGDQILMSRFSKAFNDPFLRSNSSHWRQLLEEKSDLTIDEYSDFEERFLSALINAYNDWIEGKKEKGNLNRPLTSPIENLIFDKMEWRFLQDTGSYKNDQIDWLKGQFDLYNRERPQQFQQTTPQQAPQFEDDDTEWAEIIWSVAKVFFTIFIITQLLKLFSG